ncbi:hypothetical protein JIQ42_03312 [Leishmania sp. Namibia]|uniref:hypothetical protein n=1 Tax=Leishmania sp. Namibia TaxID=2802991 RepID=UPI001B5FDC02|nr:hypothetical protein JIQ42_03312 [Leishmania sp. Namibia]
MRHHHSFTPRAAAGVPSAAAMPADAKCLDASCRFGGTVDARTYSYLEEVWAAALRQAEAAVLASPHTGRSGVQGSTHAVEADSVRGDETAAVHVMGTTQVSPTCNANDLVSSPLPCAPAPPPPVVAPGRPMPSAAGARTWMRVEAQPNLKRNAYTAHRGVAWVVQ